MATNPIPKGTKNLTVNVSEEFHNSLKDLAGQSRMTLSQYVRHVLQIALDQQLKVKMSYVVKDREESAPRDALLKDH